jgi:hypothetical protein
MFGVAPAPLLEGLLLLLVDGWPSPVNVSKLCYIVIMLHCRAADQLLLAKLHIKCSDGSRWWNMSCLCKDSTATTATSWYVNSDCLDVE